MQIKIRLRYNFSPFRLATIQKLDNTFFIWGCWWEGIYHYLTKLLPSIPISRNIAWRCTSKNVKTNIYNIIHCRKLLNHTGKGHHVCKRETERQKEGRKGAEDDRKRKEGSKVGIRESRKEDIWIEAERERREMRGREREKRIFKK